LHRRIAPAMALFGTRDRVIVKTKNQPPVPPPHQRLVSIGRGIDRVGLRHPRESHVGDGFIDQNVAPVSPTRQVSG